ncbi:hypothetical protein KAURM247S_01971 [Kitasatospora aureofaciens]
MSAARRSAVEVGTRLCFEGRTWTVVMLEGARATLVDEDGAVASVLLAHLLSAPSFALADAPTPSRVPPLGLLEELPEQAREHAMAWQRHVREVETGFPTADTSGVPRRRVRPGAANSGAAGGGEGGGAGGGRAGGECDDGAPDAGPVPPGGAVGTGRSACHPPPLAFGAGGRAGGRRDRAGVGGAAGAVDGDVEPAAAVGGVDLGRDVRRGHGDGAAGGDVQPARARAGRRQRPAGDGGAAPESCFAAGGAV